MQIFEQFSNHSQERETKKVTKQVELEQIGVWQPLAVDDFATNESKTHSYSC